MIHLDTNVAIALMNNQRSQLRARFDAERASGTKMDLSVITYHELCYGAANSAKRNANEKKLALFIASGPFEIIEFTSDDAAEAGEIRAHLRRLGAPIGPYDMMIAAQARSRGATLVTANTREFFRVPGRVVEDWSQ